MKKTIVIMLSLVQMLAFSREKLHVVVNDQDGKPIKGAVVNVYQRKPVGILNFWSDGWDTSTAETDDQGKATVHFSAITRHFEWMVAAEGYHFDGQTTRDYFAATNNVTGYDYTITQHELTRNVTLWKIRNPQPMYGHTNPIGTLVRMPKEDNGRWGFDMQKRDWVAPLGKGDVVDFYVVRKIVVTDGVEDYSGYIEIPDQGGAYKRKKNASQSFPSVYEADVNAEYLARIPFHYRFTTDGTQLLDESFANKDEYLVLKTRVRRDKDGKVSSVNYSKIIGEFGVGGGLFFKEMVFNPTPNDNNLERDWEASAKIPRGNDYTHP